MEVIEVIDTPIEVIQITEREVEVIELIERGPAGPAGAVGPQGPAGAGGVTSVTGTAPIVSSGGTTPAISVTVGSAANTVCAGNDSRIANIRSGSINTSDGTGSIELGQSGTRTTLNGAASGSDKIVTLPNATGTLALTQQATDYEVTDDTKGVIMKSPNGTRWRVTIDNNGSLLRTTLATLILSALMLCGARAQVRDLVYGTNNVVVGPTNGVALSFTNLVAFSNPITFGTNAATTRTNLGLGQTNSVTFSEVTVTNTFYPPTFSPTNLLAGAGSLRMTGSSTTTRLVYKLLGATPADRTVLNAEDNLANLSSAATARTNLGLGSLATNNSVPSGAATTNSILTADGAGGSAFVVSRTVTRFTTNDQTKTNWGFNALTQTNNNDPQIGSFTIDANSVYRVDFVVAFRAATNASFRCGVGFATNLADINQRAGFFQAASSSLVAINGPANATTMAIQGDIGNNTNHTIAGLFYIYSGTNANSMTFRWYPNNNTNVACNLLSNTMFSVTKLSP